MMVSPFTSMETETAGGEVTCPRSSSHISVSTEILTHVQSDSKAVH